jgi:hypothetical protein
LAPGINVVIFFTEKKMAECLIIELQYFQNKAVWQLQKTQFFVTTQYKGNGKTHKDASSVRATHPIPASCGLYYFEVKIVSKGRDGYMGIGLCVQVTIL